MPCFERAGAIAALYPGFSIGPLPNLLDSKTRFSKTSPSESGMRVWDGGHHLCTQPSPPPISLCSPTCPSSPHPTLPLLYPSKLHPRCSLAR